MIEGNAQQWLDALSGTLVSGNGNKTFRGVSIDSRTLVTGQLFVCLKGDKFDGHDFLGEVLGKQPGGIVLMDPSRLPASSGDAAPFVIQVADTLLALQELAHAYRNQHSLRVVGVTGTNGKSTTKEMISAVAETRFQTHKTKGNFNNHIGLPLTLLELEPRHEVAIIEMGMSAAGEIRRLAEIARPDIGVITNISEAHMVTLKNVREVQAAKGELFESLGPEDTALVNADDPLVLELAQSLRSQKITFGIKNKADVQATEIRPLEDVGFHFDGRMFDETFSIRLPFLGEFNIYNALVAVAVGHALGLKAEVIEEGISNCRLMGQRLEIRQHASLTIINDTYNANPKSMQEALRTLAQFRTSGKKFLVIGDMLELGAVSESAHRTLGEDIARSSIDYLVTLGELSQLASESAKRAGMPDDRVAHANTFEEAVQFLESKVSDGDCLLFKGSRGSHMENVMEGLIASRSA